MKHARQRAYGMTVPEIHKAIEAGQTVCWSNELYQVVKTPARYDHNQQIAEFDAKHHSNLNNELLECRCANYFGGLLDERDLAHCFVK